MYLPLNLRGWHHLHGTARFTEQRYQIYHKIFFLFIYVSPFFSSSVPEDILGIWVTMYLRLLWACIKFHYKTIAIADDNGADLSKDEHARSRWLRDTFKKYLNMVTITCLTKYGYHIDYVWIEISIPNMASKSGQVSLIYRCSDDIYLYLVLLVRQGTVLKLENTEKYAQSLWLYDTNQKYLTTIIWLASIENNKFLQRFCW